MLFLSSNRSLCLVAAAFLCGCSAVQAGKEEVKALVKEFKKTSSRPLNFFEKVTNEDFVSFAKTFLKNTDGENSFKKHELKFVEAAYILKNTGCRSVCDLLGSDVLPWSKAGSTTIPIDSGCFARIHDPRRRELLEGEPARELPASLYTTTLLEDISQNKRKYAKYIDARVLLQVPQTVASKLSFAAFVTIKGRDNQKIWDLAAKSIVKNEDFGNADLCWRMTPMMGVFTSAQWEAVTMKCLEHMLDMTGKGASSPSYVEAKISELNAAKLKNIPMALFNDNKAAFAALVKKNPALLPLFGSSLSAAILGDAESCKELSMSILDTPASSTTLKVSPACFAAMPKTTINNSLARYGDNLLSMVRTQLDESVYTKVTAAQIAHFAADVKEEDGKCAQFEPHLVPEKFFGSIDVQCYRLFLASLSTTAPVLGKRISRLSPSVLEAMEPEHISRIDPADLKMMTKEQLSHLGESAPEACSGLSSSADYFSSKPYLQLVPSPKCFVNLHTDLQRDMLKNMHTHLPTNVLSLMTVSEVSQWGGDFFKLLDTTKNAELISGLGTEVSESGLHPCSELSVKDAESLTHLFKHMHPSCAAAIYDISGLSIEEARKMPVAVQANLPLKRLEQIIQLDSVEPSVLAKLSGSKLFCTSIDYAKFKTFPATSVTSIQPRCVYMLTFLKDLSMSDIQSLSDNAFSRFDLANAKKLANLAWLNAEQLRNFGIDPIVDKKDNPAALFTSAVVVQFDKDQMQALNSAHVRSMPIEAFGKFTAVQVAAFSPEALSELTAEKVEKMTPEAFAAFTSKHFVEMGSAIQKTDKRHPSNAITPAKLAALSKEARSACLLHVVPEKDSGNGSVSLAAGWTLSLAAVAIFAAMTMGL